MTLAAPTFASQIRLDDEAYHLLNEFLEERLGLHFPEHRRLILENRLQPRLQAHNLSTFLDYYLFLRTNGTEELDRLARAITNNETYFFRERDQFEALFADGIAGLRQRLAVPGRLRLLSAGCSSGEEAHTLSFYARERAAGLRVDIEAFDLDGDRLDIAQRGACRRRSLREMTPQQIDRYLLDDGDDQFRVKSMYRNGVRFGFGNLVEVESFRPVVPYDAVFCRNVLIYFSDASMRRAIENLAQVLRPGGLLFLGHSESIIGMFASLETVRLGRTIAYRKVAR
jgi:chemotaxis protein methyltransferase CheR